MKTITDVTIERLRELLTYDADAGVFTWKISTNGRIRVGDVAGSMNGEGYLQIMIDGRRYHAHRLAWLYQTGQWPVEQIDHVNGIPDDNRFLNLRESTHSQNQHNRRKARNNVSGYKGVYWHRRTKSWVASIMLHRKRIHLGRFDTLDAAHAAYTAAAERLHGEFARVK
jgi:hypothetical protein